MNTYFHKRVTTLTSAFNDLVTKRNMPLESVNGIYERYGNPVLTAAHTPLAWRFDFNEKSNPYFMERFGINAVFNSGAIKFNNKYVLMPRIKASTGHLFLR